MSSSPVIRACASALLLSSTALLAAPAVADDSHAEAGVGRSSATGFAIRLETLLSVAPGLAYRAVVDDVGEWWDSAHTFSGEAARLSIDDRAGGCFCEELPNGGSVTHLTVVHASPGKLLRLTGGLGPLQGEAVSGAMSWAFEEIAGGTRLTLTYNVSGEVQGGLEAWAVPVAQVLKAQVDRLREFVAPR